MSSIQQFYLTRAAEAERNAKTATLANVRDRFLVSATTWGSLAARACRVERMHARLIAEKVADRAAAVAQAAASATAS